MKKTLFILLLLTYIKASLGQSTYYSTNLAGINDTMLYSTTNLTLGFNFDTTGAGISWDFSGLIYQNQEYKNFFDPNNSGYKTTWCLRNGYIFNCNSKFQAATNIAELQNDSLNIGPLSFTNTVAHSLNKDSVFKHTMVGVSALVAGITVPYAFDYDDEDTVLRFPLQYGNQDSSSSKLIMNFNPTPLVWNRNSTRINHVDGWGDLTTPYGTFLNTLRLKTTINRVDTLIFDTITIPTNITEVEYKWFDPNYGHPVLIASGNVVGGIELITQVRYLDSVRCVAPNSVFAYSPFLPIIDSALGYSTVNFSNLSTNYDSVLWDFGDGTFSNQINPTHQFYCSGFSTVKLVSYRNCDSLLTDTVTIPLFIRDTASNQLDTVAQSICFGDSILIDGNYEKNTGFYMDNHVSSHGCDSASVVDLKVINLDTGVTVNGGGLTSNDSLLGTTYQWVDCNSSYSVIVGEVSKNFVPSSNGTYAVVLNNSSCTDTSQCTVFNSAGLAEATLNNIAIFPNPSDGNITIMSNKNIGNAKIQLLTIDAKLIKEIIFNGISESLTLPDRKGIYYLLIEEKNKPAIKKKIIRL